MTRSPKHTKSKKSAFGSDASERFFHLTYEAEAKKIPARAESNSKSQKKSVEYSGSPHEKGRKTSQEQRLGSILVEIKGKTPAEDTHETNASADLRDAVAALVQRVGYETMVREIANHAPPVPGHPNLTERARAEFFAHAKRHPWDSQGDASPSEFINFTFKKWLGHGLGRADIARAQPNLASAYSVEIKRYPDRRIKDLIILPHKLPPGANRAASGKLASERSEDEKRLMRERSRLSQERRRERQLKPLRQKPTPNS